MLHSLPTVFFTAMIFIGAPWSLYAQRQFICPPVSGPVFLRCQTDTAPMPLPDRVLPKYPGPLKSAGINGIVQVKYRIDSTGRVEKKSIKIVQSSNQLLTNAVRDALPDSRFTPGIVNGNPVIVDYEEIFNFGEFRTRTSDGRFIDPFITPNGIPITWVTFDHDEKKKKGKK